ncbi:hypothetical protein M2347_000658 [Chryseobacterium sp. H1D6B]|uniref:T9SS type A sorting domain-containing protein n=1 Tax=Chryseobacterium sp. H1D6B TaxID=2940588 RepID=UPI0015C8FC50|nr:T9SS type A sorting domain-containing protein [Chryseobacterium sp. H1D6B]MDH6250931.1 hypothetical protein [Chryseobacterium sp. H1D6B]
MKKIYSLFATALLSMSVFAQTTIFSENMGTSSATNSISSNPFQNGSPVTYSGSADVRSSLTSTGYTGASGGANVFFTGTAGTNFIISGINTLNYTNIQMSFGQLKTTSAANNELTVEVSSNGTTWTPLTYTRPTGSGTANAYILITPSGTIPAASSLSIRFTNTTTGQWRLDDVKVTGTNNTLGVSDTKNGKASFVKNTSVDNEIIFGAKSDVKIYNVNGTLVKTASVSENKALNVADLPKGVYIVTGTVNGKNVSEKVIKK